MFAIRGSYCGAPYRSAIFRRNFSSQFFLLCLPQFFVLFSRNFSKKVVANCDIYSFFFRVGVWQSISNTKRDKPRNLRQLLLKNCEKKVPKIADEYGENFLRRKIATSRVHQIALRNMSRGWRTFLQRYQHYIYQNFSC